MGVGARGNSSVDIARPLVTSGAQQALKLILGGAPGGAAWASVGSAVLAALLQGQDETLAALARIEEKLDALLIDQYRNPFRSGLRMLEQAQLAWSDPHERRRLLEEARSRFTDSSAAAADHPGARAAADWHLGVTCLLAESPQAAEAAWAKARDGAFQALIDAMRSFATPTVEQ